MLSCYLFEMLKYSYSDLCSIHSKHDFLRRNPPIRAILILRYGRPGLQSHTNFYKHKSLRKLEGDMKENY